MSVDRVTDAIARLRVACRDQGRDLSELLVVCGCSLDATPSSGNAAALIEQFERCRSVGVQHLQVRVNQVDEAAALNGLDFWGHDVFEPWRG
jgi:hypothetical protein